MKQIELKFQENGLKELIELFNVILTTSNYNLDQFVDGDSLAVPNKSSDNFNETLRLMLEIAPIILRADKATEIFIALLKELDDYEKNARFIDWLERYINASNAPFKEAAFLRDMDLEVFRKASLYCLQNMILYVVEKEKLDRSIGDIEQLFILRKMILTFVDMILAENYSRENAFSNMDRLFGLGKNHCRILWEFVMENEEKLWRIMLMKKYSRIENKLDQLLNGLES